MVEHITIRSAADLSSTAADASHAALRAAMQAYDAVVKASVDEPTIDAVRDALAHCCIAAEAFSKAALAYASAAAVWRLSLPQQTTIDYWPLSEPD